jgi:poly(3-hydroxybutyrate) depolymerase
MGGIWSEIYNNNVNWVSSDTDMILPAMNVNPDVITLTGFSGGSYYAGNMQIIHSATFAGAGLRSGGPFAAGYSCSNGNYDNCDADW